MPFLRWTIISVTALGHFLGEKPSKGKVLGTILGFVGLLIVLRPEHFHWAAIIALGCALAQGVGNILDLYL